MAGGGAVQHGVELGQQALCNFQPRDRDVSMRSALPAPVDIYVRRELVDLDLAMFDAGTLRREADHRRAGGSGNLAVRVQGAACAFGQQAEVVRVDAEFEVERAPRPRAASDGELRLARAQSHGIETPVLAALDRKSTRLNSSHL